MPLRRLLKTTALVGALACSAFLFIIYPLPRTTTEQRLLLLYDIPLFGLMCFWLYCRVDEQRSLAALWLDCLVLLCAAARLVILSIPPSGHALFLSYSLVTVNHRFYRVAAFLLLGLVVAVKLSWGDRHSWGYGIALGLLCALARWALVRRERAS